MGFVLIEKPENYIITRVMELILLMFQCELEKRDIVMVLQDEVSPVMYERSDAAGVLIDIPKMGIVQT